MDQSLFIFLFDRFIRSAAASVGGTEAIGFAVNHVGEAIQLVPLVHLRPGCDDPVVRKRAVSAAESFIRPCIGRGADAVIEIDDKSDRKKFCLVHLIYEGGATGLLRAVISIILPSADAGEAGSRLEKLRKLI